MHYIPVLITRPLQQAQKLCQQIQSLGIDAISFPTIEIVAPENISAAAKKIQQLTQYDLVIFISPNAVQKSIAWLQSYINHWPKQVRVAAIGEGTAKTLRSLHIPVDIVPHEFNGEGLLKLAEMQDVEGKKILLVRGAGGRRLLAATLRERGANVSSAIVYKRVLPKIAADFFSSIQHVKIIVCTSNEALQNLYKMVGEQHRVWLREQLLLVASARVAALALKLGFKKPPVVADSPTDDDILRALMTYCPPRQ